MNGGQIERRLNDLFQPLRPVGIRWNFHGAGGNSAIEDKEVDDIWKICDRFYQSEDLSRLVCGKSIHIINNNENAFAFVRESLLQFLPCLIKTLFILERFSKQVKQSICSRLGGITSRHKA